MDDQGKNCDPNESRAVQIPAIGMSISHQISEDRNIVVQGHLPFDTPREELNGFLDRVFAASARQKALVRLPEARKKLLTVSKLHKRIAEDLVRLDAEHHAADERNASALSRSDRRNPQLSAQQLAHKQKNEADRANAETTFKRLEEDANDLKNEIAELEKTIAGD